MCARGGAGRLRPMLGDLPRPAEVLAVTALLLVLISGAYAATATAEGARPAAPPTASQEDRGGWTARVLGR